MTTSTAHRFKNTNQYLSFNRLQAFKETSRFRTYSYNNALYIFDQHISELYEITDSLKEMILAETVEEFHKIESGLSEEDIMVNEEFVKGVLAIQDEPGKITRTKTCISTLKLNTSTKCNLSCSYCFREKEAVQLIENEELMYKAIDYLVDECGRDVDDYTICFNMAAEPLLRYEQLQCLYSYTKKLSKKTGKGMMIFLITNGTILNDKLLKLIKKISKGRPLSISMDGKEKVHDALRKYKNGTGSYHQIYTNLQILKKKGVGLSAEVVLTNNYPYPLLIFKHLRTLGFKSINIKPIRGGTPYSFDSQSLNTLKDQYDQFFYYLKDQLLEQNFSLLQCLAKDFTLRPFWRILFNHKMHYRCTWGINTISMDHKGDFYPCDSVMGMTDYKTGNVETGINWEKFHLDLRCEVRGECNNCWARNICAGTCPVNGILLDNSPLTIDPVECELTRYLIEKNLVLICELLNSGVDLKMIKDILGYHLYNIYLLK